VSTPKHTAAPSRRIAAVLQRTGEFFMVSGCI
jgi:hypothetical protein